MSVTYLEISYPNFVLGSIIDPEEANQNNYEIVTKINDAVSSINSNLDNINELKTIKADKTYVDEKRDALRVEINSTIATLATKAENSLKANKSDVYSKVELNSGQLNNLYYTKQELAPWLRGGDTSIKEETFTIVSSDNGDGTFSYSTNGQIIIGTLTDEGYQVFSLNIGHYEIGSNRLEVIINDTLRRSAASGGIVENSKTSFTLTQPEGVGAEVTARYYERLGMSAEYTIKLSNVKPPNNDGKNMWFEVVG